MSAAGSMPDEAPLLIVRFPDGHNEVFEFSEELTTIGSGVESTITLPIPQISRQHLAFQVTRDGVWVMDLNSANGTLFNSQKLPPNTNKQFKSGDVLRIGDLEVGKAVILSLRTTGISTPQTLSLKTVELQALGQIFAIGRSPKSFLHLDHPAVSRRHALLGRNEDGEVWIRDENSTNGTIVNDEPIGNDRVVLQGNDRVEIGPFRLLYDAEKEELVKTRILGHRLDAVLLDMETPDGIKRLDKISLSIAPGDFVAIVGSNGTGKSTLLRALNGFVPSTGGLMLVDGKPFYNRLELYRPQMGYVPEENIIHQELPVRLALWYAARLRLPDASGKEIDQRIDSVLKHVELSDLAERPVHTLTDGQQKRVSIATELIVQPTLFFLDEPTSRLDPGLEKKMMEDLSRLAAEGRTVVIVTHATANIEHCYRVAFLSGGRLAYYGPPREAPPFFGLEAHDFSGIYLELSRQVDLGDIPSLPEAIRPYAEQHRSQLVPGQALETLEAGYFWAQYFRRSGHFKKYVESRQRRFLPENDIQDTQGAIRVGNRDSILRQAWLLLLRQFSLIRRNTRMLVTLALLMPLIGVFLAGVSLRADLTGIPFNNGADIDRYLRASIVCMEEELAGVGTDPYEVLNLACAQNTEMANRLLVAQDFPKIVDGVRQQYIPSPRAVTLIVVLGLALSQGGTFYAIYEVLRERAVFQRERSVKLRVSAYLLSKIVALCLLAVFQVLAVLLILGLKVDLGFTGVFTPFGILEFFIALVLAVFAGIMFGLFLSAWMPNREMVPYVILLQLFLQIIFSGAVFPIADNPVANMVARLTVHNWTMDSMGSIVDLPALHADARSCVVRLVEADSAVPEDSFGPARYNQIICESAGPDTLNLTYQHSPQHVVLTWYGLFGHIVFWGSLAYIVLKRKKYQEF